MADYTIKSFDRRPVLRARLTTAGGPVNLFDAESVDFIMRAANGGAVKVNARAEIVDASYGIVEYAWAAGDTDVPGKYQGEWEVTWEEGVTQTFPTLTYHSIDILADLDGNSEPASA